ncbi:hypothetical protein [Streptomyces sp. E5N298]|uniref:hypothetical protein n=1 Tax=Streptomyces sp. E5N298 TaxID=1851983 RepID=UPI000EF57FAE|nr:hypothetical protein [Streptomyces sp. E5N298]
MTATAEPPVDTVRWHVNRNYRHITRHPEPAQWTDKWSVEGFTEAEKLHGTAIHEAAHTVLLATAGVPVHSVTIRAMSEAVGRLASGETLRGPFNVVLQDLLVGLCAGERAEDRWLHETGMWNLDRAWAAERSAINDRQEIDNFTYQTTSLHLTYRSSGTWHDLATLHEHTDRALDTHWARIRDLAVALVEARHLNARQIADIARIHNPATEGAA